MNSAQMAENFKSGLVSPIAQKMIEEFPEHGLQENKVLNRHQFASYLLGYLAGKIAKSRYKNEASYAFMDRLLFRQNSKKPALFSKSLTKKEFVSGMSELSETDKAIYALLLTEQFENDEADDVKVLAAFFKQLSQE